MFAVIKTGGQQYKISEGSIIRVEKLAGEAGSKVVFDQVLMIGNGATQTIIGSPFVKGAQVTAEVLQQAKAPKVIIFKKRQRHTYRRTKGHRQNMTHLIIRDIKKD